MKAFINESPDVHKKSQKENNKIKKRNFSNKMTKNNKYFSSSLPKENKTVKKYINEKLNSIRRNNINCHKCLIDRSNDKSSPKYKTNLIYKKINITSNLNTKKKHSNDNIKKKINIKEAIYNKKNISTIKINNTNDNYNNVNYDNSKLFNNITTSASARVSSLNRTKDTSRFNYYNHSKNNFNNARFNSIERNKTLYNRVNNNIIKFLDENYYGHNKINVFNYKIKNIDNDNNTNENAILIKDDFQGSQNYQDENIDYNNISFCIDNYLNNIANKGSYNSNTNSNYVNKLKEENDALKKELKESNDQISLLKYHIKELEEKNNHHLKSNTNTILYPPNIWDKRYINNDYFESLDNNNDNSNKNNNIKEFTMSYRNNSKMAIKEDILGKINNTLTNSKRLYKNKEKIINVKKNCCLRSKEVKKSNEDYYSLFHLDKPCDKINEYNYFGNINKIS